VDQGKPKTAASGSAPDQVRVLFIAGLWRSGSTILDIILGNHPSMESVGELRNLPGEGWLGGETCACGEPAQRCEYWTEVRRRWNERVGGEKAARLTQLQNTFERLRSMPRVVVSSLFRTSDFMEYGRLLRALYEVIADVSGKAIIVDSTKYPSRALALERVPGIRLFILHLVRDGRAVIWSYHRKPNVDFQGNVIHIPAGEVARWTTWQWLSVNALTAIPRAFARGRAFRMRYEDLVTRPEKELERVGRFLDIDMRPVSERLVQGKPLIVRHMIAGNRVRHEGAVRLKPDLEWREHLSHEDSRAFWRRAGWLARRYGYQK
jgi:hypothetical protein